VTEQPAEQPADTGTTTTPRRSVSAVAADPNASPTEQPQQRVELPHTPTLPLGSLSNFAEPVTNIPPGAPMRLAADPTVSQAEPAPPPFESLAAPTLEIAAPAPLPRPGDERLIRGTAEGAAQQEELTGQAPEMPLDPNSTEAAEAQREALEQQLQQRKEAYEEQQAREKASQERLLAAQEQQAQQQSA
jgi:hypothetical protein